MTQHNLLRFAFLIVCGLAFTALAYAEPHRTFVSAQTGNNANDCLRLTPCRSFQRGHDAVAAGGEVVALDSGGYGAVDIRKAVTLTGPTGIYAGITAITAHGSAIDVLTATSDTVVLRGLTLTGMGNGDGIGVHSVGNLHIEGCVISRFSRGIGVDVDVDGSYISIKDTITRDNKNAGISIRAGVGRIVRASIDNCRSERNGFPSLGSSGFEASNNSRVTINRSVASGNFGVGFLAIGEQFGIAELNCEECVASNNEDGFSASEDGSGGAAKLRVSHSTATNNSFGFVQGNAAVFESLGNNFVRGNTIDTSGAITVVGAQ